MSQSLSQSQEEQGGIARAAGIIALGSIASRVLGLVREQIVAFFFGASGLVSAFGIASMIPKMIYEMLIGGMLSAALVPVFSEVSERDGPSELSGLFSRVLSLVAIILAAIVLLLEALASQLAWVLGGGFDPELQAVLAQMIRLIAPAVLFFGLSGVVTGLLYTRKRFTYPAFGAAVFNLGIILSVPLLESRLGGFSLPLGVLLGSVLQLLIQIPDLLGVRIRFRLDLSHPALRRIMVLYLPIALGLFVSNVQIAIDRRLASSTGESSIAWMDRATTLVQLPHGMVAVAISLAVLPTLSRLSASGDREGFAGTLGFGLRLVLTLIVPATVGLFVLAEPVVSLLFEHGKFTAYDTYWTASALRLYMLGLVFAALDWPLNYAFYARQNTLTPALVGILSVGVYLAVALLLLRPLGMLGLVLADSAKHGCHAVTMLVLTKRQLADRSALRLVHTAIKAVLATAVMAAVIVFALWIINRSMDATAIVGRVAAVAIPAGLGALCYLFLISRMRVEEIGLLREVVGRRLGRSSFD